ncbi:MAG: tRNA (adenosine(37)-N6)-dimethylallyltransferase MiaA, partial [Casimicrobiaceae bacterium]
VHALTGRPLSDLQGRGCQRSPLGATVAIAVAPADRARLHQAIAGRFDAMLDAGLVDEVRALSTRYPLDPGLPSMRCVGYRQVLAWLDQGGALSELRERGVAATRQLARRQLTWLRGLPVEPLDCFAPDTGSRASDAVSHALDLAASGT